MRNALQASLSVNLKVIPDRITISMGLEVLRTLRSFAEPYEFPLFNLFCGN